MKSFFKKYSLLIRSLYILACLIVVVTTFILIAQNPGKEESLRQLYVPQSAIDRDPTGYNKYMAVAIEEALLAAQNDEYPVGAVLVKDGKVISRSHNTTIRDHDPTAHAEINVIREGCRLIKSTDLGDYTLYTTLEPCPMCLVAILKSNIKTVVFGSKSLWMGSFTGNIDLIRTMGLIHDKNFQAYGNILSDYTYPDSIGNFVGSQRQKNTKQEE